MGRLRHETPRPVDWSRKYAWKDAIDDDLTQANTKHVTNMTELFKSARVDQPIGNLDTSRVTRMVATFHCAYEFNEAIDGWDTSRVTDMEEMFRSARSFDRPLGSWDTGNVEIMDFTFADARAFDQPIGNWNTSRVRSMRATFMSAVSFDRDLSGWDTSRCHDMVGMFRSAQSFDRDLGEWDVSSVTDMRHMFTGARAFSRNHYDALLVGWVRRDGYDPQTDTFDPTLRRNKRPLRPDVPFGAPPTTYSPGAPAAARAYLVNTYGWAITGDRGEASM